MGFRPVDNYYLKNGLLFVKKVSLFRPDEPYLCTLFVSTGCRPVLPVSMFGRILPTVLPAPPYTEAPDPLLS